MCGVFEHVAAPTLRLCDSRKEQYEHAVQMFSIVGSRSTRQRRHTGLSRSGGAARGAFWRWPPAPGANAKQAARDYASSASIFSLNLAHCRRRSGQHAPRARACLRPALALALPAGAACPGTFVCGSRSMRTLPVDDARLEQTGGGSRRPRSSLELPDAVLLFSSCLATVSQRGRPS